MDEDFDDFDDIDDIDDIEELDDIDEKKDEYDEEEELDEEELDEEELDEEELDEEELEEEELEEGELEEEELDEEIDKDFINNLAQYNIRDNTKRKIPNKERTSRNFLTKFEYPMILGVRATQIARGAKPLIDIPDHIKIPIDIARYELENKKIPFIIRRDLPNDKYEEWKLDELIISEFQIKKRKI